MTFYGSAGFIKLLNKCAHKKPGTQNALNTYSVLKILDLTTDNLVITLFSEINNFKFGNLKGILNISPGAARAGKSGGTVGPGWGEEFDS